MKFWCLAVAAWMSMAAPALGAKLALVIGNAAYTGMPVLPACSASAGLLARKLTAAGYDLTSAADMSNGGLDGAVSDFAAKAAVAPETAALVYVCAYGAGLETRDFMLPVSAHIARPTDLLAEGVLARSVLAIGRGDRTAPLLIALDLVRDPAEVLAPVSGAMARESLPDGVGVAVVAESKPPSAPTVLAAALAAAASSGALPANMLSTVTAKLPAVAGISVAGVQDAKLAAPSPAPVLPAARSAAAPPLPGGAALPADEAMSEDDRRRVQIALAALGYYDGHLDGLFGPDTRAAIRRWQHEKGISMTGRLTASEATSLVAGH